MKKNILVGVFLIVGVLSFNVTQIEAGEDKFLYKKGVRLAREGQNDYANLAFKRLANDYPTSRFNEYALFGLGEYSYYIGDYTSTKQYFQDYHERYSESKGKIFSYALLYDLALKRGDTKLVSEIKTAILNHDQLSLIFREKKETMYLSPLNHRYKAVFTIDGVSFYNGGRLIAEVAF